jgi:hypothetical protein
MHGEEEKCIRGFGRKAEGRRSFCRHRRRKDIITIALSYDGGGLPEFSGSGQEQVVSCCEHGNEPAGYIKCSEFRDYMGNWLCSVRLACKTCTEVAVGWLVTKVKEKVNFSREHAMKPQREGWLR